MNRAGRAALAAVLILAPAAASAVERTLSFRVAGEGRPPAECLVTVRPANPISALAFHPDSRRLAVGGYQEVLVWDLGAAKLAARIGTRARVRALAFADNGRTLAVAEGEPARSGALTLFDFETGQAAALLAQAEDEFSALAVSPDGKLLAAGGAEGLVRIWSMEGHRLVTTLRDHTERISGIAFSPDGKFFATGSTDKTVRVYEAGTWSPVVTLPQPLTDAVHGLAFRSDGAFLAFAVAGPNENAIRLWATQAALESKEKDVDARQAQRRAAAMKRTRALDAGAGMPLGVVWASAARPQGRLRMFVPATDNTVKVIGGGGVTASLAGHADWVYSAALSPDGTRLASGSGDGTVKLWRTGDGMLLASLVQLAPRTDKWLIMTPQGYYATSSADALHWKAPPEFAGRLANLERVRRALAARVPIARKREGRRQ